MHLRLNKSRLEIKHNLAGRVNDHWNGFTKACAMWALAGTFKSLDKKCSPPTPQSVLQFKHDLIAESPLSSAIHGVSQPHTPISSGLFRPSPNHLYLGSRGRTRALQQPSAPDCDSSAGPACCRALTAAQLSDHCLWLPWPACWWPALALPPPAPAPRGAVVGCMSLTPSCGEIQAVESWNLAGAGWKRCWDPPHKMMSSATKIKTCRVLKEDVNAATRRCMGQLMPWRLRPAFYR